jgi:hypothetical protein
MSEKIITRAWSWRPDGSDPAETAVYEAWSNYRAGTAGYEEQDRYSLVSERGLRETHVRLVNGLFVVYGPSVKVQSEERACTANWVTLLLPTGESDTYYQIYDITESMKG